MHVIYRQTRASHVHTQYFEIQNLGGEIWEGDERRKFQFLESGDSVNHRNLFSELIAFPVEFLANAFIHSMPGTDSMKRCFSSLIFASLQPLPKTPFQERSPRIPRKYGKNIPKTAQTPILFSFWCLWGISGFQNFGLGGIFSVFLVEIPERAISGLCSRPGRSRKWAECCFDNTLSAKRTHRVFGQNR